MPLLLSSHHSAFERLNHHLLVQFIGPVLFGQCGFNFSIKIIGRFNRRHGILPAHPAMQIDIGAAFRTKGPKLGCRFSRFANRAFSHWPPRFAGALQPRSLARAAASFQPRQTQTSGRCAPGFYRRQTLHQAPSTPPHARFHLSYR